MTLILALLAGAAAAAATPLTLTLARRRALVQPLPCHPSEEQQIVDTIAAHPGWYVYIHQLEAEHFVDPELGDLWRHVRHANRHLDIPDTPADEAAAYRILETLEASAATDLGLGDRSGAGLADREALLAAATKVYSAGMDRTEFGGSSHVARTGNPDRPLERQLAPISAARQTITAVTSAVGAVAAVLAGTKLDSPLSTLALLTLTFGSVIWLLVDLDTMYIDTPTFWGIGGASWVLTLAAGATTDRLGGAVTGLVVAGAVVAFIETVNQFYKRIRHQHGMGTGDYLLILATIGVPVALTGSWMLGQWILILSLLLGVIGWLVKRLTITGFTRESPYAFGPYLATGWMAGVLIWAVL